MANLLTGTASIYGQTGTIVFAALTSASTSDWLGTGSSYSLDAENKNDLRSPSTGDIIGKQFGGEKETISIDVMAVSKTTHTTANAAAALILPTIPTKVTLASFKAAAINGDWLYEGGGNIATTADGYVKMTIPLVRYPQCSATILTTIVS